MVRQRGCPGPPALWLFVFLKGVMLCHRVWVWSAITLPPMCLHQRRHAWACAPRCMMDRFTTLATVHWIGWYSIQCTSRWTRLLAPLKRWQRHIFKGLIMADHSWRHNIHRLRFSDSKDPKSKFCQTLKSRRMNDASFVFTFISGSVGNVGYEVKQKD